MRGVAQFEEFGTVGAWRAFRFIGGGRSIVVIEEEFAMAPPTPSPLRAGQVIEITFPPFTPRITIHSERELTVEIVAGDNSGFKDTVEYEAVTVRDGLVVVSWQEHIGSTIVSVLDLTARKAYTAVTPAKGDFMRLTGPIEVKSES